MKTLERIANTIIELGYDIQAYNESDLIKVNYLFEYGFYSDINVILEDNCILDDTELYYVSTYKELAEEMVDEGLFGEIPERLINYIDYESIGRDLSFDGYDLFELDNETYILRYI
jgi:antirestriction protein